MDGTLLRDDKTIAPADAEAIADAARHGIAVTLATGRLTTGTLPTAKALGLSTPLVCADGAVLIDPVTGDTIEHRCIGAERVVRAVDRFLEHGVVPFVFAADAIHCEVSGEEHRALVETWTPNVVVHRSLSASEAWQRGSSVVMTVGIGARDAVMRSYEYLCDAHAAELDTVHFNLFSEMWAVRSLPGGCDKGDMLGRLASRLSVPRERVAVVGDWLNDIGMFKYAGRAFAMGHAPAVVREAATDVLRSTSKAGGGIAEAIQLLLAGDARA